MEEDKWTAVARELAAAADSASISVEQATDILAGIQEMERAAHVLLLRAVMGTAPTAKKDEDVILECVKPPAIIPDDDLVQVNTNVPEIDQEGDWIRRRVEALDLGQTAWGDLKVVNGGGGYYGGSREVLYPEVVEVLAKALKKYRGAFVKVDMKRAPMAAEAMGVFSEMVLKGNTTLRVLKLDGSPLGSDGVALLAGGLRRNADSALTFLSLEDVNMEDTSFRRLCKVMGEEDSVPNLVTLCVGRNDVSSLKPLSELFRAKPSLKEASIADLTGLKEVEGFGEALAEGHVEKLLALKADGDGFIKQVAIAIQGNKLVHLTISGDECDEGDYDALGAAVGASSTICTLEIHTNIKKMPSRKGFFLGLGQNTSLEVLVMPLKEADGSSSSMQLADAIAKHPTLQKVTCDGYNGLEGPCAQNWASAIEKSTTLCELELETRWDDDALLCILDALPNRTSLKTFKLKRSRGSSKLQEAIKARMQGDDAKAEELIEQFCAGNAKKKKLKQEYDEQVSKQESLRILQYATGDKVTVYGGLDTPPIAGCVILKDADNWYTINRDDGEPNLHCTLKQLRPRAGHALPAGSIVDAATPGGREYRAKVVDVLPDDKYKVVPFWTDDPDKEAKLVERYQLSAVLP